MLLRSDCYLSLKYRSEWVWVMGDHPRACLPDTETLLWLWGSLLSSFGWENNTSLQCEPVKLCDALAVTFFTTSTFGIWYTSHSFLWLHQRATWGWRAGASNNNHKAENVCTHLLCCSLWLLMAPSGRFPTLNKATHILLWVALFRVVMAFNGVSLCYPSGFKCMTSFFSCTVPPATYMNHFTS